MIVKADCSCGNKDPKAFIEYDGSLGYDAIVCKKCARVMDYTGEHQADDWSKDLVSQSQK